jgi:histidyl-tRNA synthetase
MALLWESEVIQTAWTITEELKQSIGQTKIRISSTEVLDGILDECKIKFEHKHAVLRELSVFDRENTWT